VEPPNRIDSSPSVTKNRSHPCEEQGSGKINTHYPASRRVINHLAPVGRRYQPGGRRVTAGKITQTRQPPTKYPGPSESIRGSRILAPFAFYVAMVSIRRKSRKFHFLST
jgi:hypothetical protein